MSWWTSAMLSWNLYPNTTTPNICQWSLPGVICGSWAISEIDKVLFSCLRLSVSNCVKGNQPLLARNLLCNKRCALQTKGRNAMLGPAKVTFFGSLGKRELQQLWLPSVALELFEWNVLVLVGYVAFFSWNDVILPRPQWEIVLILTLHTYWGIRLGREVK